MKRHMLIAAALITMASLAITQKNRASSATNDTGTKADILELEKERNQAIISGDSTALERMTSDDYTFITLRGEMRTKAEIVQGFKTGSFHYESRQISDVNVHDVGT